MEYSVRGSEVFDVQRNGPSTLQARHVQEIIDKKTPLTLSLAQ